MLELEDICKKLCKGYPDNYEFQEKGIDLKKE